MGLLDVEGEAAEDAEAPMVTPVTPAHSHRAKVAAGLAVVFGLVLYMSHQDRPSVADVTKAVELDEPGASIQTCSQIFSGLLEHYKTNQGKVQMGHFDFQANRMTPYNILTGQDAALALKDQKTNFIQLGKCAYQERALVWTRMKVAATNHS